jgi:TP901 family phage tail tape measure protein
MSIIIPIVSAWDSKGLNKAIRDVQRAEGSFKKFTVATDAIGKSLKNTGKSLSMNVTAPLALAGGAAVNLAIGFDSSMTKIVSLVGIAGNEVDSMRVQVLKLSGETAKAPQELADGLFVLTSAGLRGNDALSALEYAAKASSAGLGETNDIARAVAGAMNAYGAETIDASKATDIITATARAGNFEVSQFSSALGRVLPFAKQAGASLEDVGGAVALLTRTNGDAAQSVTQVQALLRAFVVPTAEAVKALDSVGLSAADLRNAISTDGLPAALEMLDGKLGGNREVLGRLLGSSEAASAAFQILDADAASLAGTFGVTNDAIGMTESAFGTTADTAGFKMQKSLNGLKVVAIELGDTLVPFVEKLSAVIETATAKFQALTPEQQDMIVKIGMIVAAVGPMLIIFGSVISAIGNVAKAVKILGIALQFLTMNPIGAVIMAIVALIAIIVIIVKNWDKIKEAAGNAWARIKEIVGSAKDWIVDKMKAIGDFILKYHPLAILFRLAQEFLPKVKERFLSIGSNLVAGIREGLNNAWASFKTWFKDKMGNPIKWAKEALGIASPSKAFIEVGKNVVAGFVKGVKTLDAKKIADGFKKVTDKVNDRLANSLAKAKDKLKQAQENLKNYSKQVADSIRSGFSFTEALTASSDSRGKKSFMESLRDQANQAIAFGRKIQQLLKMGLSESALNQVIAAGADVGGKIADELIAGGASAITEANALTKSVDQVAKNIGKQAGTLFYQQGVTDGQRYVDGIKEAMKQAKLFQKEAATQIVANTLKAYKKSGGKLTKDEKKSIIDLANALGVDIPKMAKGGIVTGPTLAMIGEAGPEAVIPLSGRNAPTGTVYNITVNAGMGTNGAQVGRDIVDAIKKYERASGPVFASA